MHIRLNAPLTTAALLASGLTLAVGPDHHAATLIDTGFNGDALGTYGSQTAPGGTDLDDSTTLGVFDVTSDTANNSILAVVDPGSSGDQAVQFTDNNTSFLGPGAPHLAADLTGLGSISTAPTGNNQFNVSFNLTFFDTGTTNPLFQVMANFDGAESASAAKRIFQLQINGNDGSLLYFGTANPSIDSGFNLEDGTEYLFEIAVDLSSDLQDTYDLTVTDTTDNSVAFSVADVGTRQPNETPDTLVFSGGANGGQAAAGPFIELDNVLVTASPIPEPASLILLAAGGLCLAGRRRRVA